jgi:hypothetical protein
MTRQCQVSTTPRQSRGRALQVSTTPRQSRGRAVSLAASLAILVLAAAPIALADKAAKKPKKGTKPAPSASASAAPAATPEPAPSAAPTPTPPPAPEPAPSAAASAEPKTEGAAEAEAEAPASSGEMTDTAEVAGRKYYFVGLRYRHTIIPQFMVNLFVNEGATFHSNTIGAELDMRKDNQSMIPWIAYSEYGTNDVIFFEKNKPDMDNNYSVVNSGLKAIYLGVDELWSIPLANHLDFEYGFGVGIGLVFGSLRNDWVFANPAGNLTDSKGRTYSECQTTNDGASCQTNAHNNAQTAKVGGYTEPNWFGGGSIPVVFPHIAIPQLGLRYKPIKQVEARLGLGFSLTGFWLGLSVDYGLEKPDEKPAATPHKASHQVRVRDTL